MALIRNQMILMSVTECEHLNLRNHEGLGTEHTIQQKQQQNTEELNPPNDTETWRILVSRSVLLVRSPLYPCTI